MTLLLLLQRVGVWAHVWVQLRPPRMRMCCLLTRKGKASEVSKPLRIKKETICKLLSLVIPYRVPFSYQLVVALPHWPLSALLDISAALPYSCHTRCRCFSTGHSCLVQSLHLTLIFLMEHIHLVLDQLDIAFVSQISLSRGTYGG